MVPELDFSLVNDLVTLRLYITSAYEKCEFSARRPRL